LSFEDVGGGITKLSQLTIDADKAWAAMGISNIKEVVAGMAEGDMIYHDGTKIVKITPGAASTELITKGPTHPPEWGFIA
jgi:hypothetical protein